MLLNVKSESLYTHKTCDSCLENTKREVAFTKNTVGVMENEAVIFDMSHVVNKSYKPIHVSWRFIFVHSFLLSSKIWDKMLKTKFYSTVHTLGNVSVRCYKKRVCFQSSNPVESNKLKSSWWTNFVPTPARWWIVGLL